MDSSHEELQPSDADPKSLEHLFHAFNQHNHTHQQEPVTPDDDEPIPFDFTSQSILPLAPLAGVAEQTKNGSDRRRNATHCISGLEVAPRGKRGEGPIRPLNAYNIFFHEQKEILLGNRMSDQQLEDFIRNRYRIPVEEQRKRKKRRPKGERGALGFREMASKISDSWTEVKDSVHMRRYEELASMSLASYHDALRQYKLKSKDHSSKKPSSSND